MQPALWVQQAGVETIYTAARHGRRSALGGGEKAAEVRAMGEHELQVSGCAVAVRWQWAAADVSDWVCNALRILVEFSSYPMGFAMRKTMARK